MADDDCNGGCGILAKICMGLMSASIIALGILVTLQFLALKNCGCKMTVGSSSCPVCGTSVATPPAPSTT